VKLLDKVIYIYAYPSYSASEPSCFCFVFEASLPFSTQTVQNSFISLCKNTERTDEICRR